MTGKASRTSHRQPRRQTAAKAGLRPVGLRLQDDRRLAIAFAISMLLHGLTLTIGFVMPNREKPRERDRGLEVVLVNARHARAPHKPDVLAQAHLDGGGNSEQNARPKSPLPPQDARREGDALIDARKRTTDIDASRSRVLTAPKSTEKTPPAPVQQSDLPAPQAQPSGLDLLNSVSAVARMEAEIDRSLDELAKRPRKKFIGARAQEYRFAQYLEDWRQKIERIGTLNYPEAARGRIYGSLLLYVAIRADGTVEKAEIQRSSGEKVLDEAALRIVRLAGTFAPFPDDIRRDYDVIEFVRTWTFTNANSLTAK
ncbi:MAG TPA: TonB family protein [Aromatoleum sp.]|uniref:energy transducer TonB n=1 Tax=Aromatoleum sp. TaxID=2307007 RepID=UPI002B467A01|nr:TonB family protein [Aromatoleum sp.]HJV25296.1 TonB family protein [Aromatoleum sp.]